MNRKELRELVRIRLREVRALLKVGCYDGAYYLGGYIVEFALKSCIARKTKRHDFPDKEAVLASWTHNLLKLVIAAGLETSLQQIGQQDLLFKDNWETVADWSEASRYEPGDSGRRPKRKRCTMRLWISNTESCDG
jgi:hypothetical protein